MWRLTDEQRELREEIRGVVLRARSARACARWTRTATTRTTSTRCWRARGCWGSAFPPSTAGADSTEVVVVRLRRGAGEGLRHGLADGGVREARRRCRSCSPGSEEQKQRVTPAAGARRDARLLRADRAGVGSDPGALQTRAERHGDTLGAQRREALHRQRRARATSTSCSPAPATRAPSGISAFLVDGRLAGPERRAAAHDGHAGLEARRAAVRGRRGAAREPARPRGRRLQDRDDDLRPLAADGRRAGGRRRAGRDRPRRGLRGAPRTTFGEPLLAPPGHPVQARAAWRPTSPRRAR